MSKWKLTGLEARQDPTEQRLRELLAVSYSGASKLYADDGCLQDNSEHPFIDFRNDSVADIDAKMNERSRNAIARCPARPGELRQGEATGTPECPECHKYTGKCPYCHRRVTDATDGTARGET